jgi:hypothetical protein
MYLSCNPRDILKRSSVKKQKRNTDLPSSQRTTGWILKLPSSCYGWHGYHFLVTFVPDAGNRWKVLLSLQLEKCAMQLRRLMGLLIASVSASSLLFAGCNRQRNFDEVQPTPQQPTPNVPTQKRKADVPFA